MAIHESYAVVFNKYRREKAIEEFLGAKNTFADHIGIRIDTEEFLEKVLKLSLDSEINRNKREYKERYEETFSNFATRNKALNVEKQGEKVEFEIIEYFRRLNVAASRFEITRDNPLILKTANGETVDGTVMPSLYKIETGSERPTKTGYFNLSENMKKVEVVYTEDKLTEFCFVNILDEEESYCYFPEKYILLDKLEEYKKDCIAESVLFSALKNYNHIKKEGHPEFLEFMTPEDYDNELDKRIELGNEELSCRKLIVCKDCGNVFSMTLGECRHFTEKLKLSMPKRCPDCRWKRKNSV